MKRALRLCVPLRQTERAERAVLNHTAHHSQCICPARHILDLWGTNATGRWSEYTVYLFSHWRVTSWCLTSIAGFWEWGALGERLWAKVSGRGLWVCNDSSGFLFVIVHKKRKRKLNVNWLSHRNLIYFPQNNLINYKLLCGKPNCAGCKVLNVTN